MTKKGRRLAFRRDVFARDRHVCVMCGWPADDAHHIIDRHEIEGGGYVAENGISLCAGCHAKAEMEHATGRPHPGYGRTDLFRAINSSEEAARRAARRAI